MSIIYTLIIGLIAGGVAKLLMPGKDPGGCIVTMLLGLLGAFVGGYLGRLFGVYEPGEPAGFIASVLGALILLLAYRFLRRRT